MSTWTKADMDSAYLKMQQKAVRDAAFRKKLLANPGKTIEEFSGKQVPQSLKIKVVEMDPAYQATFLLPPLMKQDEIADKDLENVAGGTGDVGSGNCAQACAGYGTFSLK